MSHHDNIQLLRSLGHALDDNASDRLRASRRHVAEPTIATVTEQAARLIVGDLAAACLAAAADIEEQHRRLVERLTGIEADRVSSDA